MNLYDEEEVRNKINKERKVKKYISIGIVTTIILIVILMIIIAYLIRNPNKITIYVDGVESTKLESMLITKTSLEDDSTLFYFPIRDLATMFGYSSYKGDYIANFESDDSCYIVSQNERIIFKENSNDIYISDLTNNSSSQEYNYVKIKNPIIKEKENLYIDLEGMKKAFNFSINDFDKKNKNIRITTLKQLVKTATTVVTNANATNNRYKEQDNRFVNQKALLDNRIVVQGNNELYGVIGFSGNISGKEILGTQYNAIEYVPQSKVFIVERNNKVGIMGIDSETKISIQYDGLTLIDEENDLYLAKKDDKYGVIDINENIIIYLEYSKIGVDISNFAKNGIKNGYLLLDKIIPVKQNDKWDFYAIQKNNNISETGSKVTAKQITNNKFDVIGCKSKSNNGIINNIMVMEDYGLIVVGKNGYYGFMDENGSPAVPLIISDLYMETSGGKTDYYIILNNKVVNMISFFEEHSITKK